MNELISIIVPIYNVEDYLSRCIESILSQTYENLEIILVNDGSTDNSIDICKKYLEIDSRLKLIIKENGGLSSARNKGLENATGKYIAFVDSDDWIDKEMFKTMLNVAKNESADIVQCGVKKIKENGKVERILYSYDNKYNCNEDILEAHFQDKISVTVWNKLYRREIVEGIRMIEGKNNEDNMYSIEVLLSTNKVVCINDAYYNYLQRTNSIMKISFNEKKLDAIYAGNYVAKMCEKYNSKYLNYARINLCIICYYLYQDLISSSLEEKSLYKTIIIEEFNKNFLLIKNSNEIKLISYKNRFKIKLFSKNKALSLILYKIFLMSMKLKVNFN